MITRIEKIIYAKRKPITAQAIADILNLEIHTHLRNNPYLKFLNVDKPIQNKDLSKSYFINFVKQ